MSDPINDGFDKLYAAHDQGNRTSELLANYGGTAPVGEYRHVYNCPDRDLESPACDCMTPDEFKAAVQRLISQEAEQAAYDANRAVIKEQKKYLDNMTLSDGVTVIPALAVGMMYACANKLAEPLEENIKRRRLDALQGGTKG